MTFEVGDKVIVDLDMPHSNWHKCEGVVIVPEYRGRHHSRVKLTALGPEAEGLSVGHEYTLTNLTKFVDAGELESVRVPAVEDAVEEDVVNHPSHYTQYPVEVIELTRHMPFDDGNVVKYVARSPFKGNRLQDLKKARWYLDDAIAEEEKKLEEAK